MNREVHVRFSEGLGLKYPGLLDTAIPLLLEALAIKGCLVSIDAMGCQKEIASTIRKRRAHYLLAVKNNQRTLRSAIEDAFADVPMKGFEHIDRGHGRIVIQHAQVIENTGHPSSTNKG